MGNLQGFRNEVIILFSFAVNSEEEVDMDWLRISTIGCLILFAGLLSAQEGAGVKTSIATYQSGADTVSAYLALPPGKGPFPGLIVIHEWWGLNDWVKQNAERFAATGYAALAIDLYRGQVAEEPGLAHQLMRGLPPDRAVRDLQAAMEYLGAHQQVKATKIGAIGWCMGGGYALKAALNVPGLAASVINYGHLISEAASIDKINCPILGIFGADDRGIPVAQVREFEAACRSQNKQVQIQIYEGVGHAFLRSRADSKAALDAWSKTMAFMESNLKK